MVYGEYHEQGFYSVLLDNPSRMKPGSILGLGYGGSCGLAVETGDQIKLSDYYTKWADGYGVRWPIDFKQKSRFYVKAIIQDYFYLERINYAKNFTDSGVYNISLGFNSSNISVSCSEKFSVTEGICFIELIYKVFEQAPKYLILFKITELIYHALTTKIS